MAAPEAPTAVEEVAAGLKLDGAPTVDVRGTTPLLRGERCTTGCLPTGVGLLS